MVKLLPKLTTAELRAECLSMELGDSEEALKSQRKPELVALLRHYIESCGCDPKTYDFGSVPTPPPSATDSLSGTNRLGVSQPPPFDMSAPRRGHRWSSWNDEFQTFLSLCGELPPEQKKALLLHCAGPTVQRWHKTLSIETKDDEDCYSSLLRAMTEAFSP
ncbi:Uncharacterized protein FKW44_023160 [Caligus rogercresseyi]|uniref:Uncharacterized protein n=1 Tax=Caligus rogercresseyi TaxID=217165 RepID=A0A7T8GNX6_CALRO|nr:Uncharacterized protein FKW44_023160 [Caligus rogercresseyi]